MIIFYLLKEVVLAVVTTLDKRGSSYIKWNIIIYEVSKQMKCDIPRGKMKN